MKIITTLLLLSTIIFAENFEQFLSKALETSPYLKSSALNIEQVSIEGSILSRYKNPKLQVEYSSFEPDLGPSKNGYRLNYSQPIRLWSVGEDKNALTQANIKNADASYMQKRARFIRKLSLLYSNYSQSKKLLALGKQELSIAKKIYDISLARFEGGSIHEGLKLQAQVDFEMVESLQEKLFLSSTNTYFNLLSFAGVNEEIELQENYDFSLKNDFSSTQNPSITLYKAQKNRALKEEKLNSNKIEWINLFTELENEPSQDILRLGVTIPLAIFNDKSEEKSIANLEATQAELLIENENSRLNMKLLRLQKERLSLFKLNEQSKKILKTQEKLLKMYEDAYKIANISLLQLQDIKNKLIQTRRQIIQTDTALNQNAIYTNYNQGSYNE